jgi:1,4-dihydroxy-2-naphthoate octaprenyltransferase
VTTLPDGSGALPPTASATAGVERVPTPLQVWWLAARPKTLPAAATPVLVGSACAAATGGFDVPVALAALLTSLLLQIAANFANDVFDFEKGADTAERLGPTRAVQAGWVSPRSMRRALWVTLGLAFAVGLYLVSVGGPVLLALGVCCILAAVGYTGGPYPLGYHGLGDICVFVFFGLVAVAGTAYVLLGQVPPLAWLASLPIGCLTTNILVVNNVRDVETDTAAGKRTLVVRFGRDFGVLEYRVLLAVAYAVPVYLALRGPVGPWALLPWLTAPLALRLARRLERERGPALNPMLGQTARLLFLFGASFALSITLGSVAWAGSSP